MSLQPAHIPPWLSGLRSMRASGRLFIAMVVGALVCSLAITSGYRLVVSLLLGWCCFAVVSLALTALAIDAGGPTRRGAVRQDQSSRAMLVVVVLGCGASVTAIGALLLHMHDVAPGLRWTYGLLAMASIVLSWLLIHTRFAFHYAHRYVELKDEEAEPALNFPGLHPPNYYDFLYFSFVIGMTAQVADVSINSGPMRRLVLLHSLLSFGFNLVVLALAVNGIAAAF